MAYKYIIVSIDGELSGTNSDELAVLINDLGNGDYAWRTANIADTTWEVGDFNEN